MADNEPTLGTPPPSTGPLAPNTVPLPAPEPPKPPKPPPATPENRTGLFLTWGSAAVGIGLIAFLLLHKPTPIGVEPVAPSPQATAPTPVKSGTEPPPIAPENPDVGSAPDPVVKPKPTTAPLDKDTICNEACLKLGYERGVWLEACRCLKVYK